MNRFLPDHQEHGPRGRAEDGRLNPTGDRADHGQQQLQAVARDARPLRQELVRKGREGASEGAVPKLREDAAKVVQVRWVGLVKIPICGFWLSLVRPFLI